MIEQPGIFVLTRTEAGLDSLRHCEPHSGAAIHCAEAPVTPMAGLLRRGAPRNDGESRSQKWLPYMLHLSLGVVLALFALAASIPRAIAADPAIGANIVNPYKLSVADQNAMLQAMKDAGLKVIRASITFNDDGIAFAQRAWDHGIQIEWFIYRFGGYAPGGGPLSSADPDEFRTTFTHALAGLEQHGIKIAAFELGNEINLAGYNTDFQRHGKGILFGANDLKNDPEGQQVAQGYLRYLKILAVLKDLRDHSTLNQQTPVLTAGFGAYELEDGPVPGQKTDMVSVNDTLDFMRANGLDSLVDGYAVHVYPMGTGAGDPKAAAIRRERLAKYVLKQCRPAGTPGGKPCWLTEWGFNNKDQSCPTNDTTRALLVREMMGNYRPYVQQGSLIGLFYYSWNNVPDSPSFSPLTIFRCGSLTEGGKLAIDPSLLR